MSLSKGRREAADEFAALACSGKPASEVMERMLEVARLVLGATCLSFVDVGSEDGGARSWSAHADGSGALAEQCVAAALLACSRPEVSGSGDGMCVTRATYAEGRRAALAGLDVTELELLPLVRGYLGLVLAGERASSELSEAKDQCARRVAEVSAVYEIGQAIFELDLDKLLPLITEKAAAVMGAQACSLVLRDEESSQLTIQASWGLADDIIRGAKILPGEGIDGTVAQTGEAMLLVDVGADPRFSAGAVNPRKEIASSMCAPLKNEAGEIVGVLNIRRHVPSPPFTEEDLRLFCVFASQAGLAISNAKLYTSLCLRISEMSTISDLLRTINSRLDIDRALDEIANSIVHVVGFDRCCVYLSDPRSGELVAGVRRGYKDKELSDRVRVGQGAVGLAAKERIPIFERVENVESEQEASFLATPIVVRDQCIGVVVVDNVLSGRPMSAPRIELLSTFVNQAGIAIENARLYESMEAKYSELNVLFEHSKTISSAYGLENAAQISMDVARTAVQCDSCVLALLGGRRATVSINAPTGIADDILEAIYDYVDREETQVVEFFRNLRSPKIVTFEAVAKSEESARKMLANLIGSDGSALLIPLVAEDATVGAFALFRRGKQEFAVAELQLLSIVASQAAVVLKNALRYEQRMRRQVLDLSALYEFSRRISSSSSLEEALDAILGIVRDIVDCDATAIYAIDREKDAMVATASKFSRGGAHRLADEPLGGNSVMSWTVTERKAVVSPDIGHDARFLPVNVGDLEVRSFMSIPLMVQDEAVGALCVYSLSPNLYTEDDVRVLSIIASQSAAIYKELEALAALTSYTDSILSSIAAGVVTLDSHGTILTWNRAAETVTKVRAGQAIGMDYRAVVDKFEAVDSDKAATIDLIEKVRSTGKLYQGYKLAYHSVTGDMMYLNLSASVLSNSAGEPLGVVIIFEDITRDIRMEDEVRRMGELAAVGQLAATIAHELRNPLSSIKGAAQFLQKEYEKEASIVEFLDIIIEEVNGLSKLTTQFLEFARPMELDIEALDVNDVVHKTLQFMSPLIGESGIVVKENLAPELPEIQADESQLEQALRNLVLNAVQAMPDGGALTVQTKAVAGRAVELAISDTGVGIPEKQLSRIFVPFFTTKTKGTGLGLAVVQKTIENHGGHIEVSSLLDRGTTFKVTLPAARTVTTAPVEADTTERKQGA